MKIYQLRTSTHAVNFKSIEELTAFFQEECESYEDEMPLYFTVLVKEITEAEWNDMREFES